MQRETLMIQLIGRGGKKGVKKWGQEKGAGGDTTSTRTIHQGKTRSLFSRHCFASPDIPWTLCSRGCGYWCRGFYLISVCPALQCGLLRPGLHQISPHLISKNRQLTWMSTRLTVVHSNSLHAARYVKLCYVTRHWPMAAQLEIAEILHCPRGHFTYVASPTERLITMNYTGIGKEFSYMNK